LLPTWFFSSFFNARNPVRTNCGATMSYSALCARYWTIIQRKGVAAAVTATGGIAGSVTMGNREGRYVGGGVLGAAMAWPAAMSAPVVAPIVGFCTALGLFVVGPPMLDHYFFGAPVPDFSGGPD
jgi:hypothetical protein